jgi:hypothetical protein
VLIVKKYRTWLVTVTMISTICMIIGAVGPWYNFQAPFDRKHVNGLSPLNLGDARFVIVTSIVSLVLLILSVYARYRWLVGILVIVGLCNTYITATDAYAISKGQNILLWGLYMLLVGSVTFNITTMLLFISMKRLRMSENEIADVGVK